MTISTMLLVVGLGAIFVGLLLSLTAVGVFTNESRGVSKSLAVVEAFTTAPEQLKKELEPSFNDPVSTPLPQPLRGHWEEVHPG